ncbi:AraC family transcriptional regulator (plasmid) [Methylobacterium sp. NMS14P]|uniref:AraC family transcriptional regulator n=1 Tax=Methylobacterium sp. NMS14P TaxID=2894310 RepID=UPI00235A0B52|nr:AraC family transcriptional regulator [Methylobacterium sp. NMS14P]WCS28910.1 AraC family transcriptional regulator [Methylobacterium sp. NMS14P]
MGRSPTVDGSDEGPYASSAAPEPVLLRFDRQTHPDPSARARAWQAAMSVSMDTVFEPGDLENFVGIAGVRPLGPFILCDLTTTTGTALRQRMTRAKWKHDHVILDVLVSGTLRGEIGGTAVSLGVGDCVMFDLCGGMRLRLDRTRVIGLIMPRAVFDKHVGGHIAVDGLVFEATTPQAQVIGPLLTSLNAQAAHLPDPVVRALALAVVSVTAACIAPVRAVKDRSQRKHTSKPSATLARLRRFIDRQAAQPEFGVETLCTQFELSRTALYRLFKPAGGVAEAIRRRRAALAVQILMRPGSSPVKGAEIAHASGFGNERSLRNALREFYSASPREIIRDRGANLKQRERPAADFGQLFDGL